MTSTDTLPHQLFLAGEWRDGGAGTFADLNPATEDTLVEVAAASAEDVNTAVAAARAQLSGEWAALPGSQRGQILARVADLIERDAEILARLEALDIGKPVMQPTVLDVPNAARTFRHFAGWADKITGSVIPTDGYFGRPTHSYTRREPVGVIAAIVPWNTPLMIAAWKLGPALAAGNTVVVKPPEDAPLSRVLKFFGDIVTEVAIITDGDEGLFVGYDKVEFLAPVYTGDFLEVTGTVTRMGTTSRTVQLEARKVIASRYDQSPSGADVLDEPVVVVRATGTTVVPKAHSRGPGGGGRPTS